MSIKNLSNLHVLWTSMLLVATITDGKAIPLVRPPTVPHSMFIFVVTCYIICPMLTSIIHLQFQTVQN